MELTASLQLAGIHFHFREQNLILMRLYNRVNGEELKQRMLKSDNERITLSFYRYYQLGNPTLFRDHLYLKLYPLGVFGRIYVANEGINSQISVPQDNWDAFEEVLQSIDFLQDVRLNIAVEDTGKSFFKLKIKVRQKIVADGLNDETFDVTKRGTHLNAELFNQLTDLEDTYVVDMRNHYEWEVGHFKEAVLPDVETFRECLPQVEQMMSDKKDKHIVMYCTGGIRCEKASAYLKHQGFEHVYQLDGGIIQYAREVEKKGLENKFVGKNFVFDERLGERISEDVISKCHQCGQPCDTHVNCDNDACHILFIQCSDCAEKYADCCSQRCADFAALPEEQRAGLKKYLSFNGTKMGKGRYKAYRKDEPLDTSSLKSLKELLKQQEKITLPQTDEK